MSFLRRPVVLMVLGFVVLAMGGIAFATRDTGGGDSASATLCQFPPCRASSDPGPARGREGAYVVADPANPDHIVVADTNVLQGFCSFHTTFNRGKDWTDGYYDLPNGFTGCRINGPSGGHVASGSVALGSGNRVYAVFGSAHIDDNRRESVMVATSTDGGATFAGPNVAPPSVEVATITLSRRLSSMWAEPNTAYTRFPLPRATLPLATWPPEGPLMRQPVNPFGRS